MAIDLIKQQALDADPKAIQQITSAGILDQGEEVNYNTIMFFIIEEGKKSHFRFFTRNCENIVDVVVQLCSSNSRS